ncbi:MAG: phosphate ABC transporter permease PstA [Candidatus Ancillula sp.]|jgi:phosphate transport system permease protein|nr:phosphate ABC transporter permease PstA [Candidatus Ancillula sp.]
MNESTNLRRKVTNKVMTGVVALAFLITLVPLVSTIYTTLEFGITRLNWDFLSNTMKGVIGGRPPFGGIYHAIIGTGLVTFGAALIAVPIGILTAIYLVEYSPSEDHRLARCISTLVDVMTGIPSIVAGLFAYAFFAIVFGPGAVFGFSGSVALSVLMIPTVVRSTEEMLKVVPQDMREASLALGISKERTICRIVLRIALPGIITGVLLAIARIIGETAPLLITVGSFDSLNANLFSGRMMTLPVYIYGQYQEGFATCTPQALVDGCVESIRLERAWAAALVLIIIVLVLNIIGRVVKAKLMNKRGK